MKTNSIGFLVFVLGCFAFNQQSKAHGPGTSLSFPLTEEFFQDPSMTLIPGSETCGQDLGKYMELKYFKQEREDIRCTVVKTVRESAQKAATELGLTPVPKELDDIALTYWGENGDPKETKDQDGWYSGLLEKINPLFTNSQKPTIETLKTTILAQYQSETKPSPPAAEAKPNPTGEAKPTPRPSPAPEFEKPRAGGDPSGPKPPEQNFITHPTNPSLNPLPSPSFSNSEQPTFSPTTGTLTRATEKFAPLTIPNVSVSPSQERPTAPMASLLIAPNRFPMTPSPELISNPNLNPRKEYMDLALNSLKQPIDVPKQTIDLPTDKKLQTMDLALNSLKQPTDVPKQTIDLPTDKKLQTEQKGIPLATQKQSELKEPFNAQNKASESPSINFPPQLIQMMSIPIRVPASASASKEEIGTQIQSTIKTPNLSAEASSDKSLIPKTNSDNLSIPSLSVPNMTMGLISPESPNTNSGLWIAEKVSEPVKNLFSGFIDFVKAKRNQKESSQRTISSEQNFPEDHNSRNTKSNFSSLTIPQTLTGSSYLPWLTFLAGSLGTLCFLFGLAVHLRNKRSKGNALALPRRMKHLN